MVIQLLWSQADVQIFPSACSVQRCRAHLVFVLTGSLAVADTTDTANLPEIVVTSQHLDEGRSHIQTQTGASTYTIDSAAIGATPGGDNTLLNQVIMQAPEVAQDSFGQFHIRGEHNGLQYRLNGIILPEGISVFGQSLDPRLISSMSLVTGALPAEYGLRTAGIIDITTKSGIEVPGGAVSLYGGSHGTVEPSFNYGGGAGSFSYLSPAVSCAMTSASSRRTAARTRSTITPRSTTASATSKIFWMSRTAWR